MSDDDVRERLSRRLVEAQQRLRGLDATPDDKAALARRLIAVTNLAKHDVGRASERLDAVLADLDAGRYPVEE